MIHKFIATLGSLDRLRLRIYPSSQDLAEKPASKTVSIVSSYLNERAIKQLVDIIRVVKSYRLLTYAWKPKREHATYIERLKLQDSQS